jgi:GH25 family lysozyme M1 (1,4-beta-N-acetylmuramidase)
MDYVLGVDVHSVNNPGDRSTDPNVIRANWKAVYDAGVRFAFIKASENVYEDKIYSQEKRMYINVFADRWSYAKEAGLLRGPYHFLHPELNNMADQANAFIQVVGADKGELPPVLDLETDSRNWPMGKLLMNRIKEWLDRVEAAFGRKPIIYTRTNILQAHAILNAPWGMDYPLWLAQYLWMPGTQEEYHDPRNPPQWSGTFPTQPAGYQPWKIWQFSAHGKVNGFGNEDVDLDLFKGSYDELLAWAGLAAAPKPEGAVQPEVVISEPEPEPYIVVPGDTLVSIAQKANVALTQLLDLNNDVLLKPNMQLKIPGAHPAQPQPADVTVHEIPTTPITIDYVVKSLDTLSGIALQFHTTVDAIVALNSQIKNPNIISVGWVLKIPKV